MSKTKIVTRGEIALGFQKQEVARHLKQLCKYDAETLKQVFSGVPFTFKAGLDAATANRYKTALDQTGIVCSLEEDNPDAVIAMATDQPFAISHHPVVDHQEGMCCPKCGTQQPKALTCHACGIVIAKFNHRREPTPYPDSVEVATNTHADDEPGSGGWMGSALKLVVIAVLCAGGYFGYASVFGSSREVIIYSMKNCEPCTDAINYLEGEGIACTVYDVDESEARSREFISKSKGKNQLPLMFIGDIRVDGYNPPMMQVAAASYNGTLKDDGSAEVVMYCRDGCGFCKRAAGFLKENNVPYVDCDIEDMPNCQARYHELKGFGTPLILIGERVRIDGFDQPALTLALEQAGFLK